VKGFEGEGKVVTAIRVLFDGDSSPTLITKERVLT
jgi:hypothetical protein